MIGSCVLSTSRATKWTPYELILSQSIFSYIRIYGNTAYIRSYTAYIQYMGIPCSVLANPTYIRSYLKCIHGSGQPCTYTISVILGFPTHISQTRTLVRCKLLTLLTHTRRQTHSHNYARTHTTTHAHTHTHTHTCLFSGSTAQRCQSPRKRCAHTHARTNTTTHAHTRKHAHTHTHTCLFLWLNCATLPKST